MGNIAKRNGFHSLGPVLGSDHEFHFVHHGIPAARHKRSVPHTRKLKADHEVHHVFQQTGFRRVKRGYKGIKDMDYSLLTGEQQMENRNSWEELRASLDADTINPDVVHQEDYYDKLKVEAMVSLPPATDPSDPLFPYQWYLKNTGQNGG